MFLIVKEHPPLIIILREEGYQPIECTIVSEMHQHVEHLSNTWLEKAQKRIVSDPSTFLDTVTGQHSEHQELQAEFDHQKEYLSSFFFKSSQGAEESWNKLETKIQEVGRRIKESMKESEDTAG